MTMVGQLRPAVTRRRRVCGLVLSEIHHAGPLRMPPHTHELAFFSLLLAGSYSEDCGSRHLAVRPLGGIYRPPATTHRDEIGQGGARFFNVEVEPAWIDGARAKVSLPASAADFHGGDLSWLGLRLYREFRCLQSGSPFIVEGLVLELLGTLVRQQETAEPRFPAWLRRVTERLDVEYSSRLTVSALAAGAGIHPVHLARVFRRFHGTSPGEYVQRRRVQAVCCEVARPGSSLAEAALAAGFADQSHCTRAFKRLTGITPGAFRASLHLRP